MTQEPTPPAWRRPAGVAEGTWQYVHQRTIARHYDDFVAGTPLCDLDFSYLLDAIQAATPQKQWPRLLDGSSPLRIADLGAGTGRVAIPLARAGLDVIAVDLSQGMLEQTLQKWTDQQQEPARERDPPGSIYPMRCNLVELSSLQDKIVDHAVCMFSTLGMIQGRDNRLAFLKHCHRIVRPGGRFVIHVHRRWAAIREPKGFRRLLSSWIRSHSRPECEFGDSTYSYRGLEKMFMHRFSARELRTDLKQTGWDILAFDSVNLTGDAITKSIWNTSGFLVVCQP